MINVRASDLMALPIPHDVQPGPGWCTLMLDMATHIGPFDVLRICEALGGRQVYVPADSARSAFAPVIGCEKAGKICWAYRGEDMIIPTGRYAIARARRAPIIAAVRAKELTVNEAAGILGIRRNYLSRIIGSSDEGLAAGAFQKSVEIDTRQIEMFPASEDL